MIAMSGGFICPKCNAFSGATPPDPGAELRALMQSLRETASRMFVSPIRQSDVTNWPQLPPAPDYVGQRSGWYPERPRRKRKPRPTRIRVSVSLDTLYPQRFITGLDKS